jgi:hypothetical protein
MRCMEVPSPREWPEAYVPPALNADGEDDWPPPSREIAIGEARQMRLEEGLPIDDATLERAVDAAMDPEYPVPGAYFTAEELADDEQMEEAGSVPWTGVAYGVAGAEELADEPREAPARDDPLGMVDEYLRGHPEIDGGTRLGWRHGRRTLFIGLVGDAEPHKARLSEIGGKRVAFERVPRTMRELGALADRIVDDRTVLEEAGFDLISVGRDPQRGVVDVGLVGGRDAAPATEYFAGRYGDAVAVEWLGPSRYREVPHPFGSWTCEGRLLRVFFGLDRHGHQRGQARVAEESGEQIVIALTRLQSLGLIIRGDFQPHHADLELREPVGNRAVIDATEGVRRPSLTELRNG